MLSAIDMLITPADEIFDRLLPLSHFPPAGCNGQIDSSNFRISYSFRGSVAFLRSPPICVSLHTHQSLNFVAEREFRYPIRRDLISPRS
jgi:hypothetical protein